MLRLSVALLVAASCCAQPPKTAREIARAIVSDAFRPVEIFADIVFRWNLLASLPDKEQIQTLEDVFYRANEARDPVLSISISNPKSPRNDDSAPASADDRQFRAQQLLYRIGDFGGAPGQDPLEIFHQKCSALRTLLGAPLNADTERAVNSQAISILEDSNILNRSPVEWLHEYQNFAAARSMRDTYNTTLGKLRASAGGAATADGYPAAQDPGLNDPLIQSKLLSISLYGRIAAFRAEHLAVPAQQR